jgi:hypothetical protein
VCVCVMMQDKLQRWGEYHKINIPFLLFTIPLFPQQFCVVEIYVIHSRLSRRCWHSHYCRERVHRLMHANKQQYTTIMMIVHALHHELAFSEVYSR